MEEVDKRCFLVAMLDRNRRVYFDCATGKYDSAQARMCGMCKQKERRKVFKYSAQNVWRCSTENKTFVKRKRVLFTDLKHEKYNVKAKAKRSRNLESMRKKRNRRRARAGE